MRHSTLECERCNLAAQPAYHRFRFELAGVRPRYYRDNFEDALIMNRHGLDENYLKWLKEGGWKQ